LGQEILCLLLGLGVQGRHERVLDLLGGFCGASLIAQPLGVEHLYVSCPGIESEGAPEGSFGCSRVTELLLVERQLAPVAQAVGLSFSGLSPMSHRVL
jgi:hypothetical protein